MPNVIRFALVALAALVGVVADSSAAAPDRTKRVGYLVWSSYGERGHLEQALLDGMRDAGYVEGRNLVVERRYVDAGGWNDVRAAANSLAALKLDAIVSTCSPSTEAAKEATASAGIPVVMAYVADPVGQGFIKSYQKPGGNITGLSSQAEDTLPKMLQYLGEVVPDGARVAVLSHKYNPVHPRLWDQLSRAAKGRVSSLFRIDIASRSDLAAAFETIGRERAGGLIVLPDDNMTYNARAQLIEHVRAQRIPAIFGAREFVDAGGLMSYGPSLAESYRRTAVYLDKILTGAKPANLPVALPTHFEFVVNAAAAKALGISIPQHLLLRADTVLQ